MANSSLGACPPPFLNVLQFTDGGFVDGRLCQTLPGTTTSCCVPCPMTDWAYPDSFQTLNDAANWVAVVSTVCCVYLLLSWAVLPVDKTYRHYLSICLTIAVMFMNLGFVIPLAAQPEQCYDAITPNSMHTSSVCAASGVFIIIGGWGGVLWVFLRALSLHLQICWQVVVGRNFMWFSQVFGWGIPIIGIVLALTLSGVSFRFGGSCHINHKNSLADLWIPLLVFAALTIIIQFATFGYCIKVYLASLADNDASTENSNAMPSYTNSIRTMTPRQAYRRVRRVIQLQWRGIVTVLIIITDVVFFSVVFVFQDRTVEDIRTDGSKALPWAACLMANAGDKVPCLELAESMVVNIGTVGAVLILLAMNGIWLVLLMGRWTMITGWIDMFFPQERKKKEFVSVDARLDDLKKDTRSYEMLSRDTGKEMDESVTPSVVTPISPTYQSAMRSPRSPRSPPPPTTNRDSSHTNDGRRTPDYFGQTSRYHAPARSFSSPRPPQSPPPQHTVTWDPRETYVRAGAYPDNDDYVNPLGMNRI